MLVYLQHVELTTKVSWMLLLLLMVIVVLVLVVIITIIINAIIIYRGLITLTIRVQGLVKDESCRVNFKSLCREITQYYRPNIRNRQNSTQLQVACC